MSWPITSDNVKLANILRFVQAAQKRLFITAVRGVNKQFVIQYFCDIIAAAVTEKYCNDLNDAMSPQQEALCNADDKSDNERHHHHDDNFHLAGMMR